MGGLDERSGSLFSYVSLEERIPARHPLRKVLGVVNNALAAFDAESLLSIEEREGNAVVGGVCRSREQAVDEAALRIRRCPKLGVLRRV